jgi:hypothetical protein
VIAAPSAPRPKPSWTMVGQLEDGTGDVAIDHQASVQAAADFAHQAASIAQKLKPGTYDSAQALALVSIAHSLAVLADHSRQA